MTTYFTSDCHFNHRNVIGFCNRPYNDIDEMNEKLIENWNNVVSEDDEIYCLGDFGWQLSPNKLQEIGSRLKGHKHLIVGNHDKTKLHIKSQIWESVENYKKSNIGDRRIILCHYPIFDFDNAYRGALHLYGHLHKQNDLDEISSFHQKKGFYSYCVGADFNNYTPISYEEIMDKLVDKFI